MRQLSGLQEFDFSETSEYHDCYVWEDTGVLLTRAITENPSFAHFIIDRSNPHAKSAHGWSGLHAGVEVGDETAIKKLVGFGLDPAATGRRYIKAEEDEDPKGTLTSRRMKESYFDHDWWDGTSAYELSTMVKVPNEDFLVKCRKAYLNKSSDPDSSTTDAKEAPAARVETRV